MPLKQIRLCFLKSGLSLFPGTRLGPDKKRLRQDHRPQTTYNVRAERANSGMILQAFIKTFPGKSLTEIKGKDHIYLDKFAMGSVYVIKSKISV